MKPAKAYDERTLVVRSVSEMPKRVVSANISVPPKTSTNVFISDVPKLFLKLFYFGIISAPPVFCFSECSKPVPNFPASVKNFNRTEISAFDRVFVGILNKI